MQRIQLISETDAHESVRPFYAQGDPGPIAASLAQVPDLMAKALPFVGRALGPSAIDARTKEIAILRASSLQACRYCTDTHSVVALQSGLAPEQVSALRGIGDLTTAFPEAADRALLAWVDAVATSGQEVPNAVLDALKPHFSEEQVVELTVTLTATVMLNRYATAFALPVADAHLEELKKYGWA